MSDRFLKFFDSYFSETVVRESKELTELKELIKLTKIKQEVLR